MGTNTPLANDLTSPISQPPESLSAEAQQRLQLADVDVETSAPPTAQPALESEPDAGHDEWGFYDPDRYGLRAVIARIGGVAASDSQDRQRTRATVLRLQPDDE